MNLEKEPQMNTDGRRFGRTCTSDRSPPHSDLTEIISYPRAFVSICGSSIRTAAIRFKRWAILSLLLIAAFVSVFLASCKRGAADTKPADVDYYTCTMHPSVRKQHPTAT